MKLTIRRWGSQVQPKVSQKSVGDEKDLVWSLLIERQLKHSEKIVPDFLRCLKLIEFPLKRLPKFSEINDKLKNTTGWKVVPAPGLVPVQEFFELLSKKRFPSTDYIRAMSELDYTPEPDIFHDCFGHVPLLANKEYTDFFYEFGLAGLKASEEEQLRLQRIYWFTIEFGLMGSGKNLQAYGAGLISSPKELFHCFTDAVEKLPLDFDKIALTEFDTQNLQNKLFITESFEELKLKFREYLK